MLAASPTGSKAEQWIIKRVESKQALAGETKRIFFYLGAASVIWKNILEGLSVQITVKLALQKR